jgi:L-iditol 2-dehydrogenase
MKAAVLTDLRRMEVRDVPAPTIEKGDDVLIDVDVVGVCGSDVHYYNEGGIGSIRVSYPWTVGHECAGTVAAVGPDAGDLAVGDRVAVDPLIWCGHCDQCLLGRENTCRNQQFLGNPGEASGAMAEQLVMPAASCVKLPDTIDATDAALCEPLAIGEYARRLADLPPDATIAVFGAGPIGLCVLAALKAAGAEKVFVTDLLAPRRAMAERLGADWTGTPEDTDVVAAIRADHPGGITAAFECAGSPDTVDEAIAALTPGGKLMLIGTPETKTVAINYDIARRQEHTIQCVRRQNHAVEAAIELVASGRVDIRQLATNRFTLAQAPEAMELVRTYSDGVVKAVIDIR